MVTTVRSSCRRRITFFTFLTFLTFLAFLAFLRPENLMYFSAITEYCVEHLPAPQSDPRWEGYADYVSCNSDEVDAAYNNSATDPTCMCWVWDDRQMSLLPLTELNAKCSDHMPWYVK